MNKVFIGSSKEGVSVAREVKGYLEQTGHFECTIWDEGVFKVNESTFDTLIHKARLFDFALLVCSKDDLADVKDELHFVPRDNVVFEYGLFMGSLNKRHVFALFEDGAKVPTDFDGISRVPYTVDVNGYVNDESRQAISVLAGQMIDVQSQGEFSLFPSTAMAISYFENFVAPTADTIVNNGVSFRCGLRRIRAKSVHIVIPSALSDDIKKQAKEYARKEALEERRVNTQYRRYSVYARLQTSHPNVSVIYDMPTVLQGLSRTLSYYFTKGVVGKSQEWIDIESREIDNFVRVLHCLLRQDAYCAKVVRIVDENDNEFSVHDKKHIKNIKWAKSVVVE